MLKAVGDSVKLKVFNFKIRIPYQEDDLEDLLSTLYDSNCEVNHLGPEGYPGWFSVACPTEEALEFSRGLILAYTSVTEEVNDAIRVVVRVVVEPEI